MNERTIHVGIWGAGGRGTVARHVLQPGLNARIAAACDTDPAVLETCRREYGSGLKTTADGTEFLRFRPLDAVMICTPDHLHEEQAVAALEAGLDVFCEKPLATTIEGCDRILETARRLGRKLFVGHNMRYMDFTRTMKQILDAGTIGKVKAIWCRHFVSYGGDAYFRDWHADRRNSTGLLLQKGAHDLDIIHWLAGAPTVRVTALGSLSVYGQGARRAPGEAGSARFDLAHWPPLDSRDLNPVIDIEDHSMVLMDLANGVQASYQQVHYSPDAWRSYTVIGTEGRLENRGDYSGNARIEVYTRRTDRFSDPDIVYRIPEPAPTGHGGADERIVAEFIDHVRTGRPTWTSPLAARNSVAAGYQATLSLRSGGQPLEVPAPAAGLREAFPE